MLRKMALVTCFISGFGLLLPQIAEASGFNRLKAAGQGLGDGGGASSGSAGDAKGDSGKKKYGRKADPAAYNSVVFLGQFETYIPVKRFNARLSIFAEPKGIKFAARACKKTVKIRDRINAHLFKNPPSTDKKGRVETKGMDKEIRKAIKKALKTKREYFKSIYVINGRYSTHKVPKSLEKRKITDCAGVFEAEKAAGETAK